MNRRLVLKHLKDYIELKKIPYINKSAGTISCPFCGKTAMLVPYGIHLNCYSEKKKYTLIDVVKKIEEDKKDLDEEDIIIYLRDLFGVEVTTEKETKEINKLLDLYKELDWDLVPIAKGEKYPIEKQWTKKSHKIKEEWEQWLGSNLNIGVKTGQISNITIIDVDRKDIPKDLKEYLKDTIYQKTPHGFQFVFKYEKDLPKTRVDEYEIDIENDGGQCVISPSITDGKKRTLHGTEIKEMPKELKKILMDKVTVPRKTRSEKLKEEISTGNFNLGTIKQGARNDSLIRLGGIFRNELSIQQTYYVLSVINKHLCESPISSQEVRAMVNSLDRYVQTDDRDTIHEIIKYLKDSGKASKAEIEIAIFGDRLKGEKRKKIDRILHKLLNEKKIRQLGRVYESIEKIEWTDTLVDKNTPVNFKVPYFHDYVHFNIGDIAIIGSQTKYGKTTLAINIIKRLVKQGIKPYYIYSESGGRFSKVALHLGLKDGDFFMKRIPNPEEILLEDNSVVVYDWVKPTEKLGFARTDLLFDHLVHKAEESHSFMICFVQLRQNNDFFAKDQIGQYPALLSRYIYESDDGLNTKFTLDFVRDSKVRGKKFEIPCKYLWDKKLVVRKDEEGE